MRLELLQRRVSNFNGPRHNGSLVLASAGTPGTVAEVYTFGAPAVSRPAMPDNTQQDKCFRGLRTFTENKLPGGGRQVDAASMFDAYAHAIISTLALDWGQDSYYKACPGEVSWPKGGGAADWGLHSEKHYAPRLKDAAVEALAEALATNGPDHRERESGYAALHYAAQYGMVRLARALLDAGAPMNSQTKDLILQNVVVQAGGQTPLHLAARSGEKEMAQLLMERRADASVRDADGFAAVEIARLRNRDSICEALGVSPALMDQEDLQKRAAQAKEDGRIRAAKQLDVPAHLRQVYTLKAVWSPTECDHVLGAVKAAVEKASGWTTDRHAAYATTDLPCSRIPEVDAWVRASLAERVFPQLAKRHGWGDGSGSCLYFRDLFFVQYSVQGQAGLALHRDGSIISFNILLNDAGDFEGGGTYVEADDFAYQIQQGDCFVHSGKLRHGGQPVTRGERYIVVGFVDVEEIGST
ncbi:AKR2B [Symbiodinium natans]|uniref:AKR2B protein n=1 Tax=Symbiodinium natans TaxID=878477 RepID=A0A812SMT0_9DINO|nr:AKR2B [Symbiodinium natans]